MLNSVKEFNARLILFFIQELNLIDLIYVGPKKEQSKRFLERFSERALLKSCSYKTGKQTNPEIIQAKKIPCLIYGPLLLLHFPKFTSYMKAKK